MDQLYEERFPQAEAEQWAATLRNIGYGATVDLTGIDPAVIVQDPVRHSHGGGVSWVEFEPRRLRSAAAVREFLKARS